MTDLTQDPTFYTTEHEWVTVHGDLATMGITRFAAEALGDVVFVELPETGLKVERGGQLAVVESVKAASDVYAPISGEVFEVNSALTDAPEKVNEDPEGAGGWFCKLKWSDASETEGLMKADEYAKFCAGQAG